MHDNFSEDLLSAYLDGEASPQECAEVERLLESSPTLRQKLEDFRQLSEILAEQPRQTLPTEFCSEVMHAAERKMLLTETKPTAAKTLSRNRYLGIAGALTTAALLVVSIQFVNQRNQHAEQTIALRGVWGTPSAPSAASEPEDFQFAATNAKDQPSIHSGIQDIMEADGGSGGQQRDENEAIQQTREGREAHSSQLERQLSSKVNDSADLVAAKAKSANGVNSDKVDSPQNSPNRVSGFAGNKAQAAMIAEKGASTNLAKQNSPAGKPAEAPATGDKTADERKAILDKKDIKWDEVVVGQVIDAVDTSGEKIAIVKIYVIDRAAGLHAIQVALADSAIPVSSVSEKAAKKDEDHLKREPQADRMEALYVEATSEQLAKALQNLRHDKLVLDAKIAPAIAFASLDLDSQKLVTQNSTYRQFRSAELKSAKKLAAATPREAKRDTSRLRGTAEPDKDAAGATIARRVNPPPAPAPLEGAKSAATAQSPAKPGDAKEESETTASPARQMVVNIPSAALQDGAPGNDKDAVDRTASKPQAARAAPRRKTVNQQLVQSKRGEPNAAMPLQVIFVLEQRSQEAVPAAPPAKANPDGGAA